MEDNKLRMTMMLLKKENRVRGLPCQVSKDTESTIYREHMWYIYFIKIKNLYLWIYTTEI